MVTRANSRHLRFTSRAHGLLAVILLVSSWSACSTSKSNRDPSEAAKEGNPTTIKAPEAPAVDIAALVEREGFEAEDAAGGLAGLKKIKANEHDPGRDHRAPVGRRHHSLPNRRVDTPGERE